MSGLTLSSLFHIELNFMPVDEFRSILILLHADIQFDQHHLLKRLSSIYLFLVCISSFFIKDQVFTGVLTYVWIFRLVPLTSGSISMPVPCCFYCYSSIFPFEIRDDPSALFIYYSVLFKVSFSVCV